MNTGLRKLGFLVVTIALWFGGAAVLVPQMAAAKAPSIDPTSCGAGAGPIGDYCFFIDTGEDVVIAHGSCNGLYSCIALGNGTRIGHDSCNDMNACAGAGAFDGSSTIGNGSCNGPDACSSTGFAGGSSSIGSGSCNADGACRIAGAFDGARARLEATVDGSTWSPIAAIRKANDYMEAPGVLTVNQPSEIWNADIIGCVAVRFVLTALTRGEITATLKSAYYPPAR